MMSSIRRNLVLLQLMVCVQGASIGEGIIQKIATGLQHKIMEGVKNTCGKPEISNIMQNLTVRSGETASFRCTIDMKCLVSYIQWYHETGNGTVRLLRTAKSHGNPYIYRIDSVSDLDEGFYTCVAGNILGESVSSAYLQVSGVKPVGAPGYVVFLLLVALVLHL